MLSITAGTAGLEAMKGLEAFGARLPNAQANVLNRVGTKTRSAVIPALTCQTGLSKLIITRAVKMYRASPQNPRVMLVTRGGDISLRYFGAREVTGSSQRGPGVVKFSRSMGGGSEKYASRNVLKGGVLARVKGKDQLYLSFFRRSGGPGNRRMVAKLNGAVYVNIDDGVWGGRIRSERSGVYIPEELVTGETAKTFARVVDTDLLAEVERELAKLLTAGGR